MVLASICLLCVAALTGAHASYPVPNRKVQVTELRMYVPTVDTCAIEEVATTYAAVLQPALGPVAPASLIAVDGGNEYLALIRSMTFPADCHRKLVSLLGSLKQENGKPHVDPDRQR